MVDLMVVLRVDSLVVLTVDLMVDLMVVLKVDSLVVPLVV